MVLEVNIKSAMWGTSFWKEACRDFSPNPPRELIAESRRTDEKPQREEGALASGARVGASC